MSFLRVSLVFFLVIFFQISSPAEEMDGKSILVKSIHRRNFQDASLKVNLKKRSQTGREREIELRIFQRNYPEMIATLVVVDSPEDAKGISFLSWDYFDEGREDLKWYYLPALNYYQDLSNEAGRSYEEKFGFSMDIFAVDLKSAEHKLVGQEQVEGRVCYRVESTMKNPDHPRGAKVITWVDKERFLATRIESYSRDGKLKSRFRLLSSKQFGNLWQEMEGEYKEYPSGKEVYFKVLDASFNQGLKDELFLSTRLKQRARSMSKGKSPSE